MQGQWHFQGLLDAGIPVWASKLITQIKEKLIQKNISCDALHDLIQFVQFRKREKHAWRSDTFSKIAGVYQVALNISVI